MDWGGRATLFKLAISTIYRAGEDRGERGVAEIPLYIKTEESGRTERGLNCIEMSSV